MWVNLSEQELALVSRALTHFNAIEPEQVSSLYERLQSTLTDRNDPTNQDWIEKAKELHVFGTDGDREIDSSAVVSPSDDGAYVMMWGWVRNDQMGIEDDEDVCRTCG